MRDIATQTKTDVTTERLSDLTPYEALSGILVFLGPKWFPKQRLLQFLRELEAEDLALKRLLVIKGVGHDLASPTIDRVLSFMEIYQVIQSDGDPAVEFYRLRPDMIEAVWLCLLNACLDRYKNLFQELANRFQGTLETS
jgi:hypothetical protein